MKRLGLLIVLALIPPLFSACGTGNVENVVSGNDPLFQDAAIFAKVGSSAWSTTPIMGNYTNESPRRYMFRQTNSNFELGCQYVGRALTDEASKVDVYVISLKIGKGDKEYVPVVYTGTKPVVIERGTVSITLASSKMTEN